MLPRTVLVGVLTGGRLALIVGGLAVAGAAAAFLLRREPVRPDHSTPIVLHEHVRPGALAGANLVFITIDTLRRDHVGCYGYAKARTPAIDGLADRGVRFDHAVTGVPITLPSHCSMMTGWEVPRHGVHDNGRLSSQ